MNTDRELLGLAAKADGRKWKWVSCPRYAYEVPGMLCRDEANEVDYFIGWNPLTDDGDALRLAVKLGLQITPGTYNKEEATAYRSGNAEAREYVHYLHDINAATRRAIVRAAAEIGRSMA